MSANQFGTQAANYLTSAVHSTGADLERLKASGQRHPARVLDLGQARHVSFALVKAVRSESQPTIRLVVSAAVVAQASRRETLGT